MLIFELIIYKLLFYNLKLLYRYNTKYKNFVGFIEILESCGNRLIDVVVFPGIVFYNC